MWLVFLLPYLSFWRLFYVLIYCFFAYAFSCFLFAYCMDKKVMELDRKVIGIIINEMSIFVIALKNVDCSLV